LKNFKNDEILPLIKIARNAFLLLIIKLYLVS